MAEIIHDPERFCNPKSDEPILAWANRYNIAGSIRELRTMFQDANTWNLSQRIAATRKQALGECSEVISILLKELPKPVPDGVTGNTAIFQRRLDLEEIKRRIEEMAK